MSDISPSQHRNETLPDKTAEKEECISRPSLTSSNLINELFVIKVEKVLNACIFAQEDPC
jgi:hypothetical protein